MSPGELPEHVRDLISIAIPTIDALEILVLLTQRDREWTVAEISAAASASDAVVRESLAAFQGAGLVTHVAESEYRLIPSARDTHAGLRDLLLAYQRRPVTLIRTVYAIADGKRIQSFADAFRLKKKDPS
jgi:hypothetical protein